MNHIENRRNQIAKRLVESYNTNPLTEEALDFLEKGKKANLGEVRDWAGGKVQKTTQGWKPVGETKSEGKREENHTAVGKIMRIKADLPYMTDIEQLKGKDWEVIGVSEDKRGSQPEEVYRVKPAGGKDSDWREVPAKFLSAGGEKKEKSEDVSKLGWNEVKSLSVGDVTSDSDGNGAFEAIKVTDDSVTVKSDSTGKEHVIKK